MSRSKIQTAFVGAYTLAALDAAPVEEAGWLVHALCAWILRDELPTKIPEACAGAWAVIRMESETIHKARSVDRTNGGKGGRPKKTQSEPKETQTKPKETQNEPDVNRPEEDVPCPLPEEKIRVTAHNRNLPESEVEAWRNYYGSLGWKRKPEATRPMTAEEARRSLCSWADNAARFAAREKAKSPSAGFGISKHQDPDGAAKTAAAVGLK